MAKMYQVMVIGFRGEKMAIDVGNEAEWNSMTVLKLKVLQLTYTSKTLEDSHPLTYYGIQDKSMIQSVVQLPGGGTA
uniref:Ubiquitin-like domain-containing protein n=1 Tax=Hucho hucho TaxID=62062 RepID=A0A4W5KH67_9TELE